MSERTKVALALLFTLACPLLAQAGPDAEALSSVELPPELDRVLRDYERAWQAADPAALAELFSEDGFVLANGRAPVRGRAAIRAVYAEAGGALHLRALAFATAEDVGYIIGAYSGAPGAADDGKFVLTLAREGSGRWAIRSDIDNPNRRRSPEATPSATPAPTAGD